MNHYSNLVGPTFLAPPILIYHEVGETPPPETNFMLTESGNRMDTEDDRTMILE